MIHDVRTIPAVTTTSSKRVASAQMEKFSMKKMNVFSLMNAPIRHVGTTRTGITVPNGQVLSKIASMIPVS